MVENKIQTMSSRGIPGSQSLWLDSIRNRRDEWRYHEARLGMEQIMQLIFPEKYQPKYYEISLGLFEQLTRSKYLNSDTLAEWYKRHNYSKATIHNVIIPKLKRVGMVRTEKVEIDQKDTKRKYRKANYMLSKEFGMFLERIGQQYKEIVSTAGI